MTHNSAEAGATAVSVDVGAITCTGCDFPGNAGPAATAVAALSVSADASATLTDTAFNANTGTNHATLLVGGSVTMPGGSVLSHVFTGAPRGAIGVLVGGTASFEGVELGALGDAQNSVLYEIVVLGGVASGGSYGFNGAPSAAVVCSGGGCAIYEGQPRGRRPRRRDSLPSEVPLSLATLLSEARACRRCAPDLDPHPVLRLAAASRVLIIGQAPGSKVHESGRPWDDASGERLVEWLGVDRATFDDPAAFGILPMGLCYPGRGASGDKPPPPVCAATWHPPLLAALPQVRLTLLVGVHAISRYLPDASTMTEAVRAHAEHGRDGAGRGRFPLPHPSWRSTGWMRRNPWFEAEVLPALRAAVRAALVA